jgi:hypothetical protein
MANQTIKISKHTSRAKSTRLGSPTRDLERIHPLREIREGPDFLWFDLDEFSRPIGDIAKVGSFVVLFTIESVDSTRQDEKEEPETS